MTAIRNVSARDLARFATMRVLLVDDHANIRSIVIGILNALGVFSIVTAERGDLALEQMNNEKFDLLITDYEMPRMNGADVAKAVRKEALSTSPTTNYEIPILMITGNVTRRRLQEVRDIGIDEILAKPFTATAVADRLKSALNRKREFVISGAYVGPCRRRTRKSSLVGSMRRDSDLAELPTFEVEQEHLLARQEALALCKLAQSRRILGFGERESVLAMALSGAQRGKRIRDELLERAYMSLFTYIQWSADGTQFDAEIIETHGYAILELLELEERDNDMAELVTKGLEAAVRRRTSAHAA
jgi:two-component system, chemotaxis family, chemotaxis protein CheY